MSEQSLTSFESQIPAFKEIQDADWGTSRNVEPAQEPQGVSPDAGSGDGAQPAGGESADSGREVAMQRGWVPEDQWRGPKERWVDSNAFNERWEQVLPVVQKENKKLSLELKQAREEIDALKQQTAGFTRTAEENQATQRIVKTETLKMELKSAMENGDVDAQMRINDQLLDLKVADKINGQRNPQQEMNAAGVRILQEFSNDNPILSQDGKLQSLVAEQVKLMISSQSPYRGRELLDEALDRVKHFYPERFQRNGNAEPMRRHPIGETGFSPTGARSTPTRSWNDLRPEVRAALDKFVATTPGATKEGILKSAGPEYFRS
jgi:hypothetical protein